MGFSKMRPLGFSTGALAYGDFRSALRILASTNATSVELSALRQSELEPLVSALGELRLGQYSHISVHLPSSVQPEFEAVMLKLVDRFPPEWPLITHPNVIGNWSEWRALGNRVCIENMDKRKAVGQTGADLQQIFDRLPEATLCFDIGHAHQIDPTMGEAVLILEEFQERLVQLHVSEVNSESRHDLISLEAATSFTTVSTLIPHDIPAILESRIPEGQDISQQAILEMELVSSLLTAPMEVTGD
jgi:hypothetical protein